MYIPKTCGKLCFVLYKMCQHVDVCWGIQNVVMHHFYLNVPTPHNKCQKNIMSIWSQNLLINQSAWQDALCYVNVMCYGVLTAVGGAVLVLCGSRLLFLLSSSLTGSLTRTPWYGLDLASADGGAREARNRERERDGYTWHHFPSVVLRQSMWWTWVHSAHERWLSRLTKMTVNTDTEKSLK